MVFRARLLVRASSSKVKSVNICAQTQSPDSRSRIVVSAYSGYVYVYVCRVCESSQGRSTLWRRRLPLHLAWKAVSIGMVRPLEWSGVVHCRVSRSVEVPSGLPSVVYTAKEHLQRAPPSSSPSPSSPKRPGVSRARTTMEGCHSVSRLLAGFSLLYYAVSYCSGYCLRVEGSTWRASASTRQKRTLTFFTLIMSRWVLTISSESLRCGEVHENNDSVSETSTMCKLERGFYFNDKFGKIQSLMARDK